MSEPASVDRRSVWLVFALALVVLAPTTGDFGLTYDEPAYRYSQLASGQWWEGLARARSKADVEALFEPDALLYHWPYARHGINFHPPFAGQLNLLSYELLGAWLKDIPARRLATVVEFALTVTILFAFMCRRYGPWVAATAAGALLFMPRLYGQAHLIDTDMPGLFLWVSTALAFWVGLHDANARRWRILVGVLLGLAFVEKMGAVIVLLPLLAWLVLGRLPKARDGASWIDGIVTTGAMLVPLGAAYLELRRLSGLLPPPAMTNLFVHRPPSALPGAILLGPLGVWAVRRLAGRLAKRSPIWGVERPALEIWTSILAFAPAVGWLGNPAWWRETMPRLAHYYALSRQRRGSLPDIQILYLGQIYEYSLPWHNAWVLIAVTVPPVVLIAAIIGLNRLARARRDPVPLYFLFHLAVLPVLRMLETPAHDGVRLFLPAFFFLAAFAGWGAIDWADGLSRHFGHRNALRAVAVASVVGTSAWDLVRIHPYELSYYNAFIGGPRGAWRRGFELTYWYDAFNPQALADINAKLPRGAVVEFGNQQSAPTTFQELQSLGELRGDIRLSGGPGRAFPYIWLLTHDSKASAFTRILFAMTPELEWRPSRLGGARVAAVFDQVAASRAWALQLMLDAKSPNGRRKAAAGLRGLPILGRFWGEGLTPAAPLGFNEGIVRWAKDDPTGLRSAARALASNAESTRPEAKRLREILDRYPAEAALLFRTRPEALIEAVEILIRHPEELRRLMGRYGYTDPDELGGALDAGVVRAEPAKAARPDRDAAGSNDLGLGFGGP